MRIGLGCGALAVAALAANGHARAASFAAEELPLIGQRLLGSAFSRTCPDNHVLTGFRYRFAFVLDGISIKCRPVRSDGTLGTEVLAGSFAGGDGGTLRSKSCRANYVMASQVGFPAAPTGVSSLRFHCYRWSATSRAWSGTGEDLQLVGPLLPTSTSTSPATSKCSSSTQPAKGIRGRHGLIIDAIALVCNSP